jgi:hypothetical protein
MSVDSSKILIVEFHGAIWKAEFVPGEMLKNYLNNLRNIEWKRDSLDAVNLEAYRNISTLKVAIVHCTYHNTPPADLSMFHLVIAVDEECVSVNLDTYIKRTKQSFSNTNIIMLIGGARLSELPDPLAENVGNIFWFPTLLLRIPFCNQYPYWDVNYQKVDKNRSKLFDALLGTSKSHRLWVLQQLVNSRLINQSYVSIYYNKILPTEKFISYRSPDLDLVESAEAKNIFGAVDSVADSLTRIKRPQQNLLHLEPPRVSEQVPWGVYKNSYYSIVTETLASYNVFPTEKTAKPLFAKRPFVMFGGPGSLQALRAWGFLTFSPLIDESYDLEVNDTKRLAMAWKEVIKLSQLDPKLVYDQLRFQLEYNHYHLARRDFFYYPLQKWILYHIDKLVDIS